MNITQIFNSLILIFIFVSVSLAQASVEKSYQKPELIDSFNGRLSNDEDKDARVDNLRNHLFENPRNHAFVIFYCGQDCSYGEVEAHFRGIEATFNYKKIDAQKVTVINGGFREKFTTEFWMSDEGSCSPLPNSTIKSSEVKYKGLFKRKRVFYHFEGR